ncbi:hypothetical protein P154DRAFT_566138 [Amniculicola lignicola CBS 123094]|uniref:Uncharacterized protein n=1 Tax=Amniculicola lignicola CBS 123094 TaxID=1392246 RepID=A0A6A5W3B9_9PLEO|nr:hypothetical protein P154DRAFT_566138 [Amniculicola lignicola CBS 123094]
MKTITTSTFNLRNTITKEEMNLLELPVEIFEKIIHQFIGSVGERNAWDARAVCHTFRDVISWNLFNTVSLDKPPARRSIQAVLTEFYLAKLLEYRAGQPYSPEERILVFLNRAADDIIRIDPPGDGNVAPIKQQYIRDILHALVNQHPVARFKWTSTQYESVDDVNLHLALAAAVGSMKAVEHFLERGAKIANLKPSGGVEVGLFDSPVQTAAITGKHELLRFLLQNVIPSETTRLQEDRKSVNRIQDLLRYATTSAVYAQQGEPAKILLQFQQAHRHTSLGAIPIQLYKFWLLVAAGSGCLDIIKDIIPFLDLKEKALQKLCLFVAKDACGSGREPVLRYFLESNLLPNIREQVPMEGHLVPPIHTLFQHAVESNHYDTLKTCLDTIGVPNLPFFTGDTNFIYTAIRRRNIPMVKLLREYGCPYCHHTTKRINERVKEAMAFNPIATDHRSTKSFNGNDYYPPMASLPPTPSRRSDDILMAYFFVKAGLVGKEKPCGTWCKKDTSEAIAKAARFVQDSKYWTALANRAIGCIQDCEHVQSNI